MTAPIIFSIYLFWTVLDYLSGWLRFDPLPLAAPVAGIACAAYGLYYY